MKYVNETKAAKQISAYIILKRGKFVGKIQVHHGESRCTVNLWLDGYCTGTLKGPNEFLPEYTGYCAKGTASGGNYCLFDAALLDAVTKFVQCKGQYDKYYSIEGSGIAAFEKIFKVTVIRAI